MGCRNMPKIRHCSEVAGAWAVRCRHLAGLAMLVLAFASCADAQVLMPPSGYDDGPPGSPPPPGVATDVEPGAPALTRLSDAATARLFQLDPHYPRLSSAHLKVVGAFGIRETSKMRVVAAWSAGFLPMLMAFSDGRCFALSATYNSGLLAEGKLIREPRCRQPKSLPALAVPPPGDGLRWIGAPWGYGLWADDRRHSTVVTAPQRNTSTRFFTAEIALIGAGAMNGPDWPGGNITMVGRVKGKLIAVTLEVTY